MIMMDLVYLPLVMPKYIYLNCSNPNNDITSPDQLTIAYYASENDALLELNQLPNQYTSEVPNSQILYLRVERDNDCFGINSMLLQVVPVPVYNEVADEILCTYTPGSIEIDLNHKILPLLEQIQH